MIKRSLVTWIVLCGWLFGCYTYAAADHTYHNKTFGYAITYPDHYQFCNDPAVIKDIMTAGAHTVLKGDKRLQKQLERSDLGPQFVIVSPDPANGNVLMMIIQLGADAAGLNTEQVATGVMLGALRADGTKRTESPTPVSLGGRRFYRYGVSIAVNGAKMRQRTYVYLDSRKRQLWLIGLTVQDAVFSTASVPLTSIVETLKFD